jgi:hypothetical protein
MNHGFSTSCQRDILRVPTGGSGVCGGWSHADRFGDDSVCFCYTSTYASRRVGLSSICCVVVRWQRQLPSRVSKISIPTLAIVFAIHIEGTTVYRSTCARWPVRRRHFLSLRAICLLIATPNYWAPSGSASLCLAFVIGGSLANIADR